MKDQQPNDSLLAAFLPASVIAWIESLAATSGRNRSEIIRAILTEAASTSSER